MQFDNLNDIAKIAVKNGTSVFVVSDREKVEIPQAILLQPEEKTTITIEQVRRVIAGLGLKQTVDRFVLVRPAEKLGLEAANALLKSLEEPVEKVHYVLVTEMPSRLLPTILSRAMVYFWRNPNGFNLKLESADKKIEIAKRLITAKPTDLIQIAEAISKKKQPRHEALEILALTIEMLEKSYFITGNKVFAHKLPMFLKAYDNINRNGHVKLHLVADLI